MVSFLDVLLGTRRGIPCGGHGTQQGGRQKDSASKPVSVPGPIDIGRSHDPHDCADCESVELVEGIVELRAILWRWWDFDPVQARISQLDASVFPSCQTLECS
jgi:hypothetical protein